MMRHHVRHFLQSLTGVRRPADLRKFAWPAFDLGAPVLAYYALRAAGSSTVFALLVSAVLPLVSVAYRWLVHREFGRLAAFTLVMVVVGAAAALISGSVRLVFAKDALFTAAAGVWFLATVRGNRPAVMLFSKPFLRPATAPGVSWEELWEREERFRRIWRTTTLIQGVGLLLEATARGLIAWALPVELVPAVTTAQYPVHVVLILLATNVYQFRAGLFRLLREGPSTPRADSSILDLARTTSDKTPR